MPVEPSKQWQPKARQKHITALTTLNVSTRQRSTMVQSEFLAIALQGTIFPLPGVYIMYSCHDSVYVVKTCHLSVTSNEVNLVLFT